MERETQIRVRGGVPGIDCDCATNQRRRLVMIAQLGLQDPQQVQRIEVVGGVLQNFAIQGFSLRQLSALMMGDGLPKFGTWLGSDHRLTLAIFIATATIGLAQSGVPLKWDGAAMRPACQ